MRLHIRSLAVAVVILSWAGLASAQTADEVIEKAIAALGGRAAMEKIKTGIMTGTISLQTPAGDIPGTIEIYNAVPNKVRTVIKADLSSVGAGQLLIDQRFDGTSGYVMDSLQGNRDITGSQLDSMRSNSFPHPFLNYKAMGTSVTLGAKEKVGERDAFVLTFEPSSGTPTRQYIDAETFMPLRSMVRVEVPQMGEVEQTYEPSDFRAVDGVKIPHRLNVSSSIQGFAITFTKIENNAVVDQKLFSKP